MYQTWFDGVVWCARRAGFYGRVFGSTEKEALRRAESLAWNHYYQPEEIPAPRKKKGKQ